MTDSEKLDLILSEMQGMKSEMQGMKSEMQGVKTELQDLKQRVANVEDEIQGMKAEMQDMKAEIQDLKQRVADVEKDVRETKLILENEIRTNIKRVAEGHLDISRNLHEALKIDSEKEMLAIRVSVLESELRMIKTKLDIA